MKGRCIYGNADVLEKFGRYFFGKQVINVSEHLSNEHKRHFCKRMASNLPTLRAKANLSQDDLAERLGFTRQTISALEGKKRDMQWSTFSAITLFFSKDTEVRQLMSVMGILGEDVRETLNIPHDD